MQARMCAALLAAAISVTTGSAFADGDHATVAGARAAGLAGMSTTLPDRGAAIFGNPSLMPDVADGGVLLDAGQGALGASRSLGRMGSLGVGALDLNQDDRFLVDQPWNPVGTFGTGANRATLAYGVRPYARMALGATMDGWRSTDGQWSPGNTVGLSLTPTSAFAMGGQARFRRDVEWDWRVGVAWTPLPQFQLRTELEPEAYVVGIESAWRRFSVRAGLRSSTSASGPSEIGAYGVSLNVTPGSAIHYAYRFDTERYAEGTHSLSFDLPFWPAARPSVAPASSRGGLAGAARGANRSTAAVEKASGARRATVPPAAPEGTSPQRLVTSAVDKTPDIPGNARRSLRRLIEHHAEKYGVETPLILSVMCAESGFDPAAISSSKAVGLFQLLPPAARDMGIDIPASAVLDRRRDGRFHPIKNADAGIRYMAHLLQRFDWNYVLAVSAYNAGPGKVNGAVPRLRETERHVGKVLNYYYRYRNDPAELASAWRSIDAIDIPN